MAENNLTLAYLPFASQSQEDSNGKPLVNGHIEVYLAGSTTKYITYNDFDGTHNEANIPLNGLGRATVLASVDLAYDIYVYNKNNVLIYSRENVTCGTESGYLPGTIVVRVDGTENEILSTASTDNSGNLIYTESLDPHFMNRVEDLETQVSANTANILTNAEDIIDIDTTIETITSDIGGIQTHINNIDNSIITINDTLDTLQPEVDTLQTDVDIVESDVAALKLSDQYTTFKATSAAGSGGYTFKIATALKTKAPLTSTTILEYDLTNNYLGKIDGAWAMRGHVVYQQIMQMDDQYTAVDYMHYTHLYEFPDRWELWGHTAAGWAGDISVRPSKNISIDTTIHVNPWVFVGKAVSASLPTVYTEHNWVDYTMPVNNSKRTSVWAEGAETSDHKVMIDANDQGAKYLNDKILTGGILTKAIEAAGEVGDWYEVLRLTATLYTDGVTIRGAGTSADPLVALSDHESFINIDDTNSPYLIPESVDEIIVSTATDDVVVTLPVTSLKRFYVKWLLGTHNLTVNVANSGMIDGVSSFVFNTKFSVGTSVSFVCKESGDWIANGTITDGQVDTYKAMCSTGDVPGYLENKLVGSTWINASEIPLSSDEKNIMFALKNPDFFVKGNTIHGGTVIGVIGDLNEQSHNGYYTCYYSTLHAPPAQPGNPSWFIHHMNSNTANYYAVQIAYAYTTSIICYERTKVAGVWQPWSLRSAGSTIIPEYNISGNDWITASKSELIDNIYTFTVDTSTQFNNSANNWNNTYDDLSSNSANWNNKLDKTSADTLYQSIGSYLSTSSLDSLSANWNSTYISVDTNSAQWNSAANLEYFDTIAGSGITLSLNDNNQVVINNALYDSYNTNSAIWNNKLDKTSADTLYQSIGSYLSTSSLDSLSANWNSVSGKQDIGDYAYNSSINPTIDSYALNSGIWNNKLDKTSADTLYQNIGNYLSANTLDTLSANWNEISGKQALGDYAYNSSVNPTINSYAANSANWNNTYDDLSSNSAIWNNKLDKTSADTLYQSIGSYLSTSSLDSLSANWESTYNTVNSNSANWESHSIAGNFVNYYPTDTAYVTGISVVSALPITLDEHLLYIVRY